MRGFADFCQSANTLDVDELIRRFTELESRSVEVREKIVERNAANARLLRQQFDELSALLLPPAAAAHPPAGQRTAPAASR